MPSSYSPLVRREYFEDHDGALSRTKRRNEVVHWSHDWGDLLVGDEAIESVAYVDRDVTRSSTTLAGSITSCDVGGVGEFEVTVTTDAGRVAQLVVRFYES